MYGDDVYEIFNTKRCTVDSFLTKLYSRFPSINFTSELEEDGQLSLLNSLVIRKVHDIESGVFRNPISLTRDITADSNDCY